jgi:methyl-accepting chemotaxis protein
MGIVQIIAAFGFGTILAAAVTGWLNRPKTKADASKSTAEAASLLIDQLQEQVESSIARAEKATEKADAATAKAEAAAERAQRATADLYAANRKIERLTNQIDILTGQLAAALQLLEQAGHDVQRFYQTLEDRGVPLTTIKGD